MKKSTSREVSASTGVAAPALGSASWLRKLVETREEIHHALGFADEESEREEKREVLGLGLAADEIDACEEALTIIADNLKNDDGQDPESWWLELTADEAALIRKIAARIRSKPNSPAETAGKQGEYNDGS